MSIPDNVRDQILESLRSVERVHGVRILYACESGSRAWGFASQDSDFDVRFIYSHGADWYLSIDAEDRRDVIELPIDEDLDINGWDIRKALRLLRKSNPPLLEWLGSPIVYLEDGSTAEDMRALASRAFSPAACAYHYLHMARGNFRESLKSPQVWRKKYLYVLRPLLAIQWIEKGLGVVPTPFQALVDATVSSESIRAAIGSLLEEKRKGFEKQRGPRIDAISDFIESELQRLESSRFNRQAPPPSSDEFNRIFRETIAR